MIAQLANGGHKIYPKIIVSKNDETYEEVKAFFEKNYEINKDIIYLVPTGYIFIYRRCKI